MNSVIVFTFLTIKNYKKIFVLKIKCINLQKELLKNKR